MRSWTVLHSPIIIIFHCFARPAGIQGLYDFGPMGCAMKANLLNAWRQHFVLEDQLLEIDCSMLTPHPVLEASGHVERFTDWMVKDVKNGECFRADHLIKANLEAKLKHKSTPASEKPEIEKLLHQVCFLCLFIGRVDVSAISFLSTTLFKYKCNTN